MEPGTEGVWNDYYRQILAYWLRDSVFLVPGALADVQHDVLVDGVQHSQRVESA